MGHLPLDPFAFHFGKYCIFKEFSMNLIVETHVPRFAYHTRWKGAVIVYLLALMR